MQIVSSRKNLHEMLQPIFLENKKNIFYLVNLLREWGLKGFK